MKRFTKIFLIAAAVFCALGICLSMVGLAMGASWDNIRDVGRNAGLHFSDWDEDFTDDFEDRIERDIENFAEGLGRTIETSVESAFDSGSSKNSKEQTYTFQANEVQELDVELKYDSLILEPSGNSDEITVAVEGGNPSRMTVKHNGKELTIESSARVGSGGSVTITYPREMVFKEAELEVDAGEIIFAGDFQAKELSASIGAGSLDASGTIVCTSSSWEVGAGSIDIGLLDSQKTELECGMGELYVSFTGEESEYNYELECGMGQLDIGDESYSQLSGKQKIRNGGSRTIEAECGMGQLSISFEN